MSDTLPNSEKNIRCQEGQGERVRDSVEGHKVQFPDEEALGLLCNLLECLSVHLQREEWHILCSVHFTTIKIKLQSWPFHLCPCSLSTQTPTEGLCVAGT